MPSFAEAKERMKEAAEFSDLVHVDIADGKFTPHITGDTPENLQKIVEETPELKNLKFEIHLMVDNPEGVIDSWLRTGLIKRIIIHLEAMTDSVYILEKCERFGAEAMLAINPGTEAERLLAYADDFSYFQVLAVSPGPAGQSLQPNILDKIKFLKEKTPNVKIEIDGGVNDKTISSIKDAGTDIAVSGTYIFESENPKSAYEELKSRFSPNL